jgi:hypothetical protein
MSQESNLKLHAYSKGLTGETAGTETKEYSEKKLFFPDLFFRQGKRTGYT